VPSDEPGTRRYERIGEVRPGVGFTGTRFYLFQVAVSPTNFQFNGEERARPIGEVTLSLSFLACDSMRSLLREATTAAPTSTLPPRRAADDAGPNTGPSPQFLTSQLAGRCSLARRAWSVLRPHRRSALAQGRPQLIVMRSSTAGPSWTADL
jgi:hypothetical protein